MVKFGYESSGIFPAAGMGTGNVKVEVGTPKRPMLAAPASDVAPPCALVAPPCALAELPPLESESCFELPQAASTHPMTIPEQTPKRIH